MAAKTPSGREGAWSVRGGDVLWLGYAWHVPLRPRAHTIEDESEQQFRQAVPVEWAVRKLDPDYGIDLTIEIFDETGHSTPFSFHAQLKATEEEDVSKALRSIRFRRDLAEYYWSLAIPVLIVRYHSPSGQLYARWFHAYNPLVAARPDADAEPSKTVGFVFTERDAWTRGTPDELADGVESFRRFRSPDLPLPLTFSVSIAEGMQSAELIPRLFALRRALATVSHVIALQAGGPRPDRPQMVIGASSSTVALADVASVTLDHEEGQPDHDLGAANLGCAAAMLLAAVGQTNLAAQVAVACAAKSTMITGVHAAFTLAGAFFRAQRIREALTVVTELVRRGDVESRFAAFVLQSAVLARGSHLTDAEAEQVVDVARVSLEATLAAGNLAAAAGDAYNLGKALGRIDQWDEAVSAYEQAAELNPDYENRAYFHADLGGSLFESSRYEEAVGRYERAVASRDHRWCIALLADSLMLAGRYGDAQVRFAEYLVDDGEPSDCVWRLKHRVLVDVRSLVGDAQDRRPDEAAQLADRIDLEDPSISVKEAFDLLDRAFEADACCGAAHNRRMFLSLREGPDGEPDLSGAIGPAISAAVLHGGDPGAWVNVIRMAADQGEPDDVLYDLMRTGVRSSGQEVIDGVLAASTPPMSGEHLALLDRAEQDLAEEKHREGFVLRMPAPDGDVTEIAFSPPDGD